MHRAEAIGKLREKLAEKGLHAIIIPTNDPHFGEYTQDYYKVREWLSGFNGSAGTLVVTLWDAALWTDSRYFVQAEAQLSGSGIELMKLKMPGTPSVEQWLLEQFADRYADKPVERLGVENCRVAIDESLFSYSEFCSLNAALGVGCGVNYEGEKITCAAFPVEDMFNDIWQERKPLIFNPIEYILEDITGESTVSKYARLKESLAACVKANGCELGVVNGNQGKDGMDDAGSTVKGFAYIVTACDEVAWLCNIRGTDVEYNPLVQSYAVVTHECVNLFASKKAISKDVEALLVAQGVRIFDYSEYIDFLKAIPDSWLRICSTGKVSVRDYRALAKGLNSSSVNVVADPVLGGALNRLKSVKNATEQEGFRKAFLQDGIAWCKLLKYIDDSLKAGVQLDEYELGEKLIGFRKALPGYKGESFEPIVAFGANAALPHYSATADNATEFGAEKDAGAVGMKNGNFLLMDTGAQFLYGTTDTTRTVPVGELDEDKKRFYTLVLKGMIALSRARFPKGTRGAQLDILARGPLFGEAVMYYHGTGHGIGHYLCVHEGPQSVRMEENPVPLEAGMVISNEPAIYFAGRYGIRTENVIMVKPWIEGEFGCFNEFETFTRVPIATSCVLPELLAQDEIDWLNNYNAQVYKDISPLLDTDAEREWLCNATKVIL